MIKRKGNHTGNAKWEGYCIDMLQLLAKGLGFNYIIHESYDLKYGGKDEYTQEWNGMVNEIATGVRKMSTS